MDAPPSASSSPRWMSSCRLAARSKPTWPRAAKQGVRAALPATGEPPIERSQRLRGALRWRHPDRGIVSPAEFIPVAEDIGLIVPRRVGPQRSLHGGIGMAARYEGRGQSLASPVSERHPRAECPQGPRRRGVCGQALELELMNRSAPGERSDAGDSASAARAWRPNCPGRFRNGLFLAELPAQLPSIRSRSTSRSCGSCPPAPIVW